ncbi:hypothetical protein EDB81DRAFT_763290 [Dactylonectria macrodidyma]|uniref:GRF-like zinc ribbon domain-containing protein n=1 Tax=Dactylonectria macrodidyma TaxID=307937 RepID=A0A9P9E6F0_9HYPO|nr:hypothetical protein EDB81DRAFT_763290 [Dactylonectria macrodidyma]
MEPSFPLNASPTCRSCGKPCKHIPTKNLNRYGNAGRPYYTCEDNSHSRRVFGCFDDAIGVSRDNPPCRCGYASRRTRRNDGASHFFSCPVGRCGWSLTDDTPEDTPSPEVLGSPSCGQAGVDALSARLQSVALQPSPSPPQVPSPDEIATRRITISMSPSGPATSTASPSVPASTARLTAGGFFGSTLTGLTAPSSVSRTSGQFESTLEGSPTQSSSPAAVRPFTFGTLAAWPAARSNPAMAGGLFGSTPPASTAQSDTQTPNITFAFGSTTSWSTTQSSVSAAGGLFGSTAPASTAPGSTTQSSSSAAGRPFGSGSTAPKFGSTTGGMTAGSTTQGSIQTAGGPFTFRSFTAVPTTQSSVATAGLLFRSTTAASTTQSSTPATGGLFGSTPPVSTSPSSTPPANTTFTFGSLTAVPTSQSSIPTGGLFGTSPPGSTRPFNIPASTANSTTAGIVGSALPDASTRSSSERASSFQASGHEGPATPPESPQPSIFRPMLQPEGISQSDVNAQSAEAGANRSGESVSAPQSTIGVAGLSAPTFRSASGSTASEAKSENAPDEALENAPQDAPQDAPETTTAPLPITSDDIEARPVMADASMVSQPAAPLFVTATDDSPPRISSPRSRVSVSPASSVPADPPSASSASPSEPGAQDFGPAVSRLGAGRQMFKVRAAPSSNLSQEIAPPRPVPAEGGISRVAPPALPRDCSSCSDEERQKPVSQPLRAVGHYESDKEIPKSRKRLLCCTVMLFVRALQVAFSYFLTQMPLGFGDDEDRIYLYVRVT